jgi:hypothetical protein
VGAAAAATTDHHVKRLRRDAAAAEQQLWHALRNKCRLAATSVTEIINGALWVVPWALEQVARLTLTLSAPEGGEGKHRIHPSQRVLA